MEEPIQPARFYRDTVRQLWRQYDVHLPILETDFRAYLEHQYAIEQARLAELITRDDTQTDITATRNGLFVLAAGLLSYGRLDAADTLVDYVPASGAIRRLALSLKALLPLPEELSPLQQPEAVKLWLERYRGQLRWDEGVGRFLLLDQA
jgi:hypothetical protein